MVDMYACKHNTQMRVKIRICLTDGKVGVQERKKSKVEGETVRRQAGRMMVLWNEIKGVNEQLSIAVEQEVNNDGVIRL